MGFGNATTDVDVSSGDILGALDFGAMLYLEMHNPKWAFSLDALYMNLGGSGPVGPSTVDVDLKQSGVMAAGYLRVKPWAEAMLGFQFNGMKGSLKGRGALNLNQSGDKSWVDPYLGARLTLPRQDKWRFGFNGFVGGFGVGSKFAWQVYPNLGYRFNPLFELNGGYRAMYMDYESGSGSDKFVYKLTTQGPQLGFLFHF